jgi:hypothetical protein
MVSLPQGDLPIYRKTRFDYQDTAKAGFLFRAKRADSINESALFF